MSFAPERRKWYTNCIITRERVSGVYKKRNQMLSLALSLIDSALCLCSLTLAGLLRYGSMRLFFSIINPWEAYLLLLLLSAPICYAVHRFDRVLEMGSLDTLYKVVFANICVFAGITCYLFCTRNTMALSRLTLMYFGLANTALQYLAHLAVKRFYRAGSRRANSFASRLLVFADRAQARQAVANARKAHWRNVVAGVVLTDCDAVGEAFDGVPVVATMQNYLDYATANVVDEVLVLQSESADPANPTKDRAALRELIANFELLGVVVNLQVPMVETGLGDTKRVYQFGDYYVIGFTTRLFDYRLLLVKRLMDILGACVGLLLTALIAVAAAPLIVLDSRGPVFFAQDRVGRNGRIFRLYKFRSMRKDADALKASMMGENEMQGPLFKMQNDPRITRVGRFLRRTSLDEMPQFWNVLKGEMSLVGTRPPTVDEYMQYTPHQKRRLSFRPGITGLWQISGRNRISSFQEVVELDLEYIDNWSIRLDSKILAKTLLVVIERKGAA